MCSLHGWSPHYNEEAHLTILGHFEINNKEPVCVSGDRCSPFHANSHNLHRHYSSEYCQVHGPPTGDSRPLSIRLTTPSYPPLIGHSTLSSTAASSTHCIPWRGAQVVEISFITHCTCLAKYPIERRACTCHCRWRRGLRRVFHLVSCSTYAR